jgi:cyclic beta-1,2-glucan synthetase
VLDEAAIAARNHLLPCALNTFAAHFSAARATARCGNINMERAPMNRLRDRFAMRTVTGWDDSQPVSAEIFGAERARQHARSLAASQEVTQRPQRVHSVIDRLKDNAAALLLSYKEISDAISKGKSVTPAAEWLIDNYHQVEEQIAQTRADLPQGFYDQLPKLAGGHLAGHPRIFGLVWAHVAHTDSRFDPSLLTDFVNVYQEVQPLTIGELWAVAISLRLILIENLRRVSTRIVTARRSREEADVFADQVLSAGGRTRLYADILRQIEETNLSQPFVVQLVHRLRDQEGFPAQVLDWLKLKMEAGGASFEAAVSDEHHRQGAANVTVRNIVTSMRLISDVNWEIWFDSVSLVDKELRERSRYGEMDFPSRTIYRTAVEELARGSALTEPGVAGACLAMAQAAEGDDDSAARDPGYYLIGQGRKAFEAGLGFKPPVLRRLRSALRASGLVGYLGAAGLVTSLVTLVLTAAAASPGSFPAFIFILAFAALLPASEAALSIVNFSVTRLLDATILPGLILRDGVPGHLRTLVAVPILLTSRDDTEEMIDRLEVHYLSNSEGELYFALVTDWADSREEETNAADLQLLDDALAGIAALNQRYAGSRFLLLHRPRKWNGQQGRWMGWERKRGKLHELNRLLLGAEDTSFSVIGGEVPKAVRYVLTLDADTKLPRDAARRLVGKIAHPLNQPRFDASAGRVTRGYAVLQPRVTPSLPTGHNGSLFQRIFSTPRGTDPYVFAVSDVYQDLFGEGSFAGKGIYDVAAFEAALAGRIPENTMLSHDLFEGIFARSALVTDVEVVEEYPERYTVAASRQHRWTRGDWQLLPWLTGRGKDLPALGRWKMTDNLRRSLLPLAALACLLLGWWFLPAWNAALWTLGIVLLGVVPPLLPALSGAIPRQRRHTFESRVKAVLGDFGHALAFSGANLIYLAHQAGLMADAIVRTLHRLRVSHRNLLEWTTAAQTASSPTQGLAAHYSLMAASAAAGFAALALTFARSDGISFLTAAFALAWFAAPAAAFWMSRVPKLADTQKVSIEDIRALRATARRTWRFFEAFVTEADSMLPPDNFQEDPDPRIAHRTSPTNIGLYLLSVAGAKEFGWLGLSDAAAKLEATLSTVKRMEKYRGHLYNWYDTQTLAPLEPKYVSSVDSGNLAGHLIALSNCCSVWASAPADDLAKLDGIGDAAEILAEECAALPDDRRGLRPQRRRLETQIAAFRRSLAKAREAPEMISVRLIEFAVQAASIHSGASEITAAFEQPSGSQLLHWASVLRETIESQFRDASLGHAGAQHLKERLKEVESDARSLALEMEFGFLLDPQRMLFAIGFRVPEAMRDESCYDMLASEARLGSYFAIAKGDLRTRHWFRLGRSVTAVRGGAALISWSGSMFEYLMPSLVMRAPSGGLLDQTTKLVVRRQINYAAARGVPWGISESAFNARDIEFTYQYSNFGIPGLGLKRGLSENLVIAPYATGLASMISPHLAVENYKRLEGSGARGEYGFYEALDFTPSRLRKGETAAIVRAYFAHHQGMTIVAVLNSVKNGVMRERFHAEPMVRAAELLLQERAPRDVPLTHARAEIMSGETVRDALAPTSRMVDFSTHGTPATHLMSNGRYSVMLTAAGGGYSAWNGLALTRWREDITADDWGSFFFLRDVKSGRYWSAGLTPGASAPDRYAAAFTEDKAEISRTDGNFATTMDVVVSPEDDVEVRRVTVTNAALGARDIELTSYAELVLAPQAADVAHPAFSKMFVQTEFIPELETLIATRRRRSPGEPEVWIAQFMLTEGAAAGALEFETDRAKFIGMGNDRRGPRAMRVSDPLSNTRGATLDPIFAFRRRIRIPAGRQSNFTLWTAAASTREGVLDLVDRHRQAAAYERALTLSWTQAQIQLRHLSINHEEAHLFQALAGHVIFASAALRPGSANLMRGMGPQSMLWPHGISGDRPIVLVRIDDIEDIELVHEVLRAFEYWKTKQLAVDIVILNERMSSYTQDLQLAIEALVRKSVSPKPHEAASLTGDVFTLRADLAPPESLRMLPAAARVVLVSRRGNLASQLARLAEAAALPAPPERRRAIPDMKSAASAQALPKLEFFNGWGGYSEDGREYVTALDASRPTPAPWINVIANSGFGFQCSADGGGYTWFGNSRENQITPWSNDAVSNAPGEAIYVSDDDSGGVISPTLKPMNSSQGAHLARHGFGYSLFEREADQLKLELLQSVHLTKAVKFSRLRITNQSQVRRRLTVTFYAEWTLGASRAANAPFITTAMDEKTGAMFARNPWSLTSSGQVTFADMGGMQSSWTGDRREFLGAFGHLSDPAALRTGAPLSGAVGAGFDTCCAMQAGLTLEPGASDEITIFLGAAASEAEAQSLVIEARQSGASAAMDDAKRFWKGTLGAVQVKTPDRSFDIIMNGWLLYQSLACRMWGRSGFYQASGAYGFRDQLQDSLSFLLTCPEIAREQILRAAARQFVEGDFQHWWLPATGAGVRTRISDDNVWLGFCVSHYIKVTGDAAILDVKIPFIEGQHLAPGAHDAFFVPQLAEETGTLFEHCARALDLSLAKGAHGLPLMGTGDWNDGMNRVGEGGKGESVWLGWFLLATLKAFIPLALARKDKKRASAWKDRMTDLAAALERDGWDGDWYRRGFFDDGAPLGSAQSEECRIDAIAQSWAVISGGASPERAAAAMEQSYTQLVRPQDGLALLFTPPFDKSAQEPGYIKAYPPGIRENGGQYTHGVIWSIFAHAKLGQAERAMQLFSMINPINHSRTPEEAARYRVEPYVIAADVYSVAPHVGRGGWTWYTGSAGWMHRAGLEAILGITREGAKLRVKPCIPAEWPGFEAVIQIGSARYEIKVTRNAHPSRKSVADVETVSPGEFLITLRDDGVHAFELPLANA